MRKPIEMPDLATLREAFDVVHQYHLHVYQLLHMHDPVWSMPGRKGLFSVEYLIRGGMLILGSDIQCVKAPDYSFATRLEDTDESILGRCQKIVDAIAEGKEKEHRHACCPLAEQISCVCVYACKCAIHGGRHVGSHD